MSASQIADALGVAPLELLQTLDEILPKVAPMSPRVTIVYPSLNRAQCNALRELVERARASIAGRLEWR
jgi:hypothetical protein